MAAKVPLSALLKKNEVEVELAAWRAELEELLALPTSIRNKPGVQAEIAELETKISDAAKRQANSLFAEKLASRADHSATVDAHYYKFLQTLCNPQQYSDVSAFIANSPSGPPSDNEERLRLAKALQGIASAKIENGDHKSSVFFWLATLHYLDFPPGAISKGAGQEAISDVITITVQALISLGTAMRKSTAFRQAETAADLGLNMLDHESLSRNEAMSFRVELCHARALAKGGLRNFEGAQEDAGEVLKLSPNHVLAKRMLRNCQTAIKSERGAKRWTLPLDVVPPPRDVSWITNVVGVVFAIIALIIAFLVQRNLAGDLPDHP